ncbi:transcriptional regulator family: Fungal Specific TF [Penicillium roqueforti]|nr:transcriptional regulator family: Fungal Specific TF [Penicillium roqueforti]KAI3114574.1 transcriptional regulator family: Fungal Specific TF [Penicillium roqueforti]
MDSPNEKEVNPLNTTEDEMNKRHASGDLVSSESILHSNQPHFQFVESIEKPVARSHAMKTYWRRKKGEQQQEEYLKPNQPSLRPLRPLSKPRAVHEPETSTLLSPTEEASSGHGYLSCSVKSPEELGIPGQLFANISFTFACVLGQKVEANSFQISAHHHRFFYHWLSMHAHIIHSGLQARTFTPFTEIWMPLDLSNAASFNGILAHAAADLMRFEGGRSNPELLKYKTEAIETINKWLGDTVNAITDDVFAGVVRLLTFERHWGTRERFNMHKHGLQQMVQARGGYKAFGPNWRIQLVLSLAFDMVVFWLGLLRTR